MRILHVWNTAGVGSIIAKYMDRIYGTESWVVMRKSFDKFGFTIYGECWDCSAEMFALRCLLLSRKFDIVHIHAFDRFVPYLKLLYPSKPAILHYHGTDIRNRWLLRQKYWSKADAILYSTPDLLDDETPKNTIYVYIPNPVDTGMFHPYPESKRKPNSALAFDYYLDVNKAYSYAQRYGISLEILERNIPYRELPKKLSEYEYYIDKTEIPSLSKTALEALACGLKVIRWDGEIVDGLPEEHKPEKVVQKIWGIYQRLLEKT
ncbi:hypothetical protein KEJ27_09945 [Candidatus Bathyarchaeota archaeon]|nr:hypothetical protein [Candidatus Bathyarchaeota archaeon]MBS7613911.1 hypothetical protein [Candidatus Bathyarchaeota archaeon]MBS7617890.1 hypothetical protein [Candidatus Bathyarchaeota archaeon]